jgi:predicted adenylyl cyclase CyaB
MNRAWLFADSEDTTVITLERILRGESDVLLVTHDLEDGAWQFLDGEHVFEDDGTVVCLGEMVQFDPSLEVLADLPVGWFAWRAARDHPWQRCEGEPTLPPARRGTPLIDHLACTCVNVEIKARVSDIEPLRPVIAALSDTNSEVLDQEDVFFAAPEGRLKLRIFAEDTGELILYRRADTAGPRSSHYQIARTSAPTVLRSILSQVLPVVGVVRKRRLLYLVGQTRVHLDRVEGLGDFVELEVVLRAGQSEAEGGAIARDLMNQLGIGDEQLECLAYIDLLANAHQA